MNRLVPLVWSLVGVSLCAFTAGLLLLPQRLLQRPLAEGVIAVHLESGGRLRLWHQPISPDALATVLAAAARRQPLPPLRLVPDPQVPWAEVRRALVLFHRGDLPLELQLPVPAGRP
jgi:hypothetical protein